MKSTKHSCRGRTLARTEMLEGRCMMAAGDLDPTFGTNGVRSVAADGDYPRGAVALANGKLLVVAQDQSKYQGTGASPKLVVTRINADGSTDTSFANAGHATVDIGTNDGFFSKATVTSTGITVVGSFQVSTGDDLSETVFIVRLTLAGQLDTSFDGDGKLSLPQSSGTAFGGGVVLPDNRVRLLFNDYPQLTLPGRLVGLTATGSSDTAFATNGSRRLAGLPPGSYDVTDSYNDRYSGMIAAPDNSLYLYGGTRTTYDDFSPFIQHLAANGSTTISEGVYGNSESNINGLRLAPDGKLFGWVDFGGGSDERPFVVADNDLQTLPFAGYSPVEDQTIMHVVGDLAVVGDYVYVLYGGRSTDDSSSLGGLERLNLATLQPDRGFGELGTVTINRLNSPPGSFDGGLTIDSFGKPVLAGSIAANPEVAHTPVVYRFLVAGEPARKVRLRDGVLYIDGYAFDDIITVKQRGSRLRIAIDDLAVESFAASAVKRLSINGYEGNDTIYNGTTLRATVRGTDGSKYIRSDIAPGIYYGGNSSLRLETGTRGGSLAYAEDGSINVTTGGGDDTIYGGAENDRFAAVGGHPVFYGGGDGDEARLDQTAADFFGGDGVDTVFYNGAAAGLRISADNLPDDGVPGDNANIHDDVENIAGSAFDDYLVGNAAANLIWGGNGNDTLVGGERNDTLDGGLGSDLVYGQTGNDLIYGSHGGDRDTLEGGAGVDTFQRLGKGKFRGTRFSIEVLVN